MGNCNFQSDVDFPKINILNFKKLSSTHNKECYSLFLMAIADVLHLSNNSYVDDYKLFHKLYKSLNTLMICYCNYVDLFNEKETDDFVNEFSTVITLKILDDWRDYTFENKSNCFKVNNNKKFIFDIEILRDFFFEKEGIDILSPDLLNI